MGQMTLAFTRLLLREVSCNTLGNHGLLVVYIKQSFIQHTWVITKEQYTNHMQWSKQSISNSVIYKMPYNFKTSIFYSI
jgi:hypothetical protein